MKALSHCSCGQPLPESNPEHATYVWEGRVYHSLQCMANAQSVAKCHELGLVFQPDLFELPLRLNPG